MCLYINTMSIDIEKIKSMLRWDYTFYSELQKFNMTEKTLVDEIIAHNKKCDKDPKYNTRAFWQDIIRRSSYSDGVLGAVVVSPYAPSDIIIDIAHKTEHPYLLLEILKKDIFIDDRTYDLIQKKSKSEMCNVLKKCYNNIPTEPLPFNQAAIDYYAKKVFNKPKVKNDNMLIMLAYTKDMEFLSQCHNSPKLNESRLNYLIDNINLDESTRNKMFIGMDFNFNDITPDYNMIKNPTHLMTNEIYRLNSDGYFITKDKSIKKTNLNKIRKMITSKLTTEGIEKDIICKYEKRDSDYRTLLAELLSTTPHISTLEYAQSLDYRIFDHAFNNNNITDKFLQNYGLRYIDKILASIKRTGHIPQGVWYWEKVVKNTALTPKQYDMALKNPEMYFCSVIASSHYTPDKVLKEIVELPNEFSYNVSLAAKLHLEMKAQGFSENMIEECCYKVCKTLHYGNTQPYIAKGYKDLSNVLNDMYNSNQLDEFKNIISHLQKEYKRENEEKALSLLSQIIKIYSKEKETGTPVIVEDKNSKLSKLYDERYELLVEFTASPTIWDIYFKIDQYADKLINVHDEINKIRASLKTTNIDR